LKIKLKEEGFESYDKIVQLKLLAEGWVQIVHTLPVETDGGKQSMNCANTEGILDASIIDPREVFKPAIKNSASKIILVHNHPSGNPEPSKEDRETTEKLIVAGEVLGIKVLDYIIIGRDNYWSWKECGHE
jgi:proteasome lid subunit RPN8/RPN11